MSIDKKAQNLQTPPTKERLAVVGGGISGLMAAYYANKNGQPGAQIDIYEASGRVGGKLENEEINGEVVNKGGEFVDSTNVRMRALCKELGVGLIPCEDQKMSTFQHPDGHIVPSAEFLAAYKPLSEQIIKDKAAIAADPQGEVAKRLDGMSAEEYLRHLAATITPEKDDRSNMKWLWDTVTFQSNRVDPAIVQMAVNGYASESGNHPGKVSAMQFAMEASGKTDAFLESDCAFRIEGGTEHLIKRLEEHLKDKKVNFHKNHRLEAIGKTADGKLNLEFAQPGDTVTERPADKVILAMPAHRIGRVKGLENVGYSAESIKTLQELQYTQNIKFTVAVKPGAKLPRENFSSNSGFQTWNGSNTQMTFLCTPEDMKGLKPAEYVAKCCEQYAKAHGLKSDEIFDRAPGKVSFAHPGTTPCYASLAVGQMIKVIKMVNSMDGPAAHGVAMAGTFFPMMGANNRMGIGFMECGLNSAMEASMRLCPPQIGREHELSSQRQIPHGGGGVNRPMTR